MMPSQKNVPIIIVKRLMVFKNSGIAYDQQFQYGVNIIRGDNGTGKSSVMDFLYYGLGAEITEWNEHQAKCTHTLIEVMFNYKSMCLKREITDTGKAPMFIYDGTIDKALSDEKNCFRYPNARNKETHSYSQQIFDLLGLPSHKTDDASNLTMHQILRLMYVDQLTDPTKLLKDDKKYDNATIRRAIGEFLLGIDDLEAHNLRQDLIEANREFDAYSSELKAIYRFLGTTDKTDNIIRKEQLNSELKTTKEKITSLEKMRSNVRNEKLEVLSDKVKTKAKEMSSELDDLSVKIFSLQEKRSVLNSELIDTGSFINSLSFRKNSLKQSELTNESLGDMIFKYCPSCLSLLEEHDDENSCSLCKTELNKSHRDYAYIQMINEINFQLRESESLRKRYRAELGKIESMLPNMSDKLIRLKSEYNDLISNGDIVDAALSELGAEIGFHRSQINHLNEKVRIVDQVEELINKKNSAKDAISRLKENLTLLEEASKNRVDEVYSSIEDFSKKLISYDGGYENIFNDPDEVTFDFARDKMAVNGRSKFSASSMVIIKNSIRAAIFIHSIGDKKTRLPRFILMDNMEDKGMTAERSQNFQRVLVERCDELKEDYQIIFTTSMIDKELNKSDYVVGPFYKKGDHTLLLT